MNSPYTGSAVPIKPKTSTWVIRIDVLPVLRMRRMVGDRGRASYGKSDQEGAGFSTPLFSEPMIHSAKLFELLSDLFESVIVGRWESIDNLHQIAHSRFNPGDGLQNVEVLL